MDPFLSVAREYYRLKTTWIYQKYEHLQDRNRIAFFFFNHVSNMNSSKLARGPALGGKCSLEPLFPLYSESRPIQTISLSPFVVDSPLVFPTTESYPLWGSAFMKVLIKSWPDLRLFLCLLCSHEILRSCVTGSINTLD